MQITGDECSNPPAHIQSNLAKSSNMVIQHDAELHTNITAGNQKEIGSKTNLRTVA